MLIFDVQMFIPLKTSGAFHSRYMEKSKQEFAVFINTFTFSELVLPVISNVHARPYKQADIKQNLIDQITQPVKWTESIRHLMGLGEMEFAEIGQGKVLTGLVQRIKREAGETTRCLIITVRDSITAIRKKHMANRM